MPKTVPISWPVSTSPGTNEQESGGRLINVEAEPLGQESPLKVKWYRQPGLSAFCDTKLSGYRGGIYVNSAAYILIDTSVLKVASDGTFTTLTGSIAGTDKVTFARNNEATPAIQCVSPANGAYSVADSGVASFSGGGNLPSPNSVCGQDGYFFWSIGDNRLFAAGPNGTTVNSQTYTTVQSRPVGNLLRVVPYEGLLWAFASQFCQVYIDNANPAPTFPYSRYAVIDCGLFGRSAIAGWEDGFGAMLWAGPGPQGLGVYQMNGTTPTKVSPPDLDRLIQAIPFGSEDNLEAFVFAANGHNYWVLSYSTWTWAFNINTQKWHERSSLNAGLFSRWRLTGPTINAFGKWLGGDTLGTQWAYLDASNNQELGSKIRFRMESAPVIEFPKQTQISRADFMFVTGVGIASSATYTGQNPVVEISCSRNGGETWDNPRQRKLGAAANSRQRVYVTNCGMAGPKGVRWRMDISDEVYASFLGATMSSDPRANANG